MKKLFLNTLFFTTVIIFASCGKDNPTPQDYGSINLVNAATINVSAPSASLYLNDSLWSNGFVGYNTNSGFLGVITGVPTTVKVKLDNGVKTNTSAAVIATEGPTTFNVNDSYTFITFDTISNGKVKILKLKDTLVPPSPGITKVRFWQLSPTFNQTVDVTYLRINNSLPVDSVTITNRKFPTETAVSENKFYTNVNSGGYVIRIKVPGTQTLITQVGNITPTGVGSITLGSRKIISSYLTGNAAGRPLAYGQVTEF